MIPMCSALGLLVTPSCSTVALPWLLISVERGLRILEMDDIHAQACRAKRAIVIKSSTNHIMAERCFV